MDNAPGHLLGVDQAKAAGATASAAGPVGHCTAGWLQKHAGQTTLISLQDVVNKWEDVCKATSPELGAK